MNKNFFILLLMFAVLQACKNSSSTLDNKSYLASKQTIAQEEKNNPLQFLKVIGSNKKNLIGQTVVKGIITNTATICSYKNVRIKMLSYKSEKMVEEHENVIDDVIKPNTRKAFKTKYRLPKGTDSVALSIMHAEVADNK